MVKIVTHNPHSIESFNFETLTQCISTIHSALQSFSHIVELLTVEDSLIRFFYEFECMRNVWSVKELRNKISKNLHIRVGLSKSPELVMKKLTEITEHQNTVLQIRPYGFRIFWYECR